MDEDEQIRRRMEEGLSDVLTDVLKRLENDEDQPGWQDYIEEWNNFLREMWEIASPPEVDPSTGLLVRTDPPLLFPTRLISTSKIIRDKEALKNTALVEGKAEQHVEQSIKTVNNGKVPVTGLKDVEDIFDGLPHKFSPPQILIHKVGIGMARTKEKAVNMEKTVSAGKVVHMVAMEKGINLNKAVTMRNARKKRSKKPARVIEKAALYATTPSNGVNNDQAPAINFRLKNDDEQPEISRHSHPPTQSVNTKKTIKMGKAVKIAIAENKLKALAKEVGVVKKKTMAKQKAVAKDNAGYKEKAVVKEKMLSNGKVVAKENAVVIGKAVAKKKVPAKDNTGDKEKVVAKENTVDIGKALAKKKVPAKDNAGDKENTVAIGKPVTKENTVVIGKVVTKEKVVVKEKMVAIGKAVGKEKVPAKDIAGNKVNAGAMGIAANTKKAGTIGKVVTKENAGTKVNEEKSVTTGKAAKDTVTPKVTSQVDGEAERHA